MSKTKQTTARNVLAKALPGFKIRQPRYAGRPKRTAQMARDLADSLGCDPLEFMMRIINSDTIEQTVIVDGKKQREEVTIPLDTRLHAAKTVVNYLYPRLTAQQITDEDDGPVEIAGLDLTKLLQDPALVEMAQTLAIAMSEAERTPAPTRICTLNPD